MSRPLRVRPLLDDGEFVVAGTDDEQAARAAALDYLRDDDPLDDEAEQRERIAALRARPGWYRWNPCHESSCYDGGGHGGHLGYAQGAGRGNFPGVYLMRGSL